MKTEGKERGIKQSLFRTRGQPDPALPTNLINLQPVLNKKVSFSASELKLEDGSTEEFDY